MNYVTFSKRKCSQRQFTIDSVRSVLRDGTSALHNRAEDAFESHAPIDSAEGLSNFLHCMLKAHSQFRVQCDRASCLAGLQEQSDSLIAALIADLKMQPNTIELTDVADEHFCLGVGYVFEGSALGANIIKKRLATAGMQKSAYLNCVTSSASSRWPRFIKKLDTCRETESIMLGAVSAFEFIITQAESTQ